MAPWEHLPLLKKTRTRELEMSGKHGNAISVLISDLMPHDC